jgi:hypothetical protein
MSFYLWLLLAVIIAVGLLAAYLFHIAIPRSQSLLAATRRQHHTRRIRSDSIDEDDAATATAAAQAAADLTASEPMFDVTTVTIDIESLTNSGSTYLNERRGVAEVLSLHGQSNPAVPLFLIIPGNPGLVGFYRLFMLYLDRLCKGHVEFRCVSFAGHTSKSLNQNRTFSLQDQLKFFRAYLKQLIAQHPQRKIFLSGHSVGAYVCLQMLDSLTCEQAAANIVPQTFLLFPTVFDIGATPNGIIHTPVLNYGRPLIIGLIAALSRLPKAVKNYILFRHVGLHPFEVEAAHGVLQVHTAKNCLEMAMHEMVSDRQASHAKRMPARGKHMRGPSTPH